MDFFSKFIYGKDNNVEMRNIIWNSLASMIYALSSMLIGIVTTKILGAKLGGLFFFAFSTLAQQIYILAYFAVRPIQITDIKFRYSFLEYRNLRLITNFLALLLGIIYTFIFAKTLIEISVYLLMIFYKILDAFADLLESEWQRKAKLYIAGKSIFFRTLISVSSYLFILYLTKNLILASIIFVLSLALSIFIFNYFPLKYISLNYSFSLYKLKSLFNESKWLFLSTFLDLYIFASSKFSVEILLGSEVSAYYTIIFIPTSIINLLAGMIIRPILTNLSNLYELNKKEEFKKFTLKIFNLILYLSFFVILFTIIFGKIALNILFKTAGTQDIYLYYIILIIVIIGGCFYAIINLMYYILVILGNERYIFKIYVSVSILAFIVSFLLTKFFGSLGASISYLILMFILASSFTFISYIKFKEWKKSE